MKAKEIYRNFKNSYFTGSWMRYHLQKTTCKYKGKVNLDDWEDLLIQKNDKTTKKV